MIRFRPCCFAWYNALSAWRNTSPYSCELSKITAPILTDTLSGCCST
ncbi:Uncharacterised protein [Vibrio cholerae]|nr:Uncharacterised protein [Vibrio cholerae]